MVTNKILHDCLLYFSKSLCDNKQESIQWMNKKAPPQQAYCPSNIEHVANIISHAMWILPSIFATCKLIEKSHDSTHLLSALVYGGTLILLFSVSTCFHCLFFSVKHRNLKQVLHRCDRAMIYLFIASSYFPWLMLENLPHEGWASKMKWLIWVMAFMGITYQQIFHEKYKMLEIIFYLVMGIGPVLPIITEHYFMGMVELIFGGALYILGVVFFKCDGVIPFAHAIWHLFVVMAAGAHYYAILVYLYPEINKGSIVLNTYN